MIDCIAGPVYAKHYLPLESDPAVFTELIHELGVSHDLTFQDIVSIDDPELISLLPRPVYALVLIFPTSEDYELQIQHETFKTPEYHNSENDQTVIWFKQTINNACGLYAILHAVSNGAAKEFISQWTFFFLALVTLGCAVSYSLLWNLDWVYMMRLAF